MIRALVTGSTGCVGSNLVAALNRRGIEVVGLRWNDAPTLALEGLKVSLVTGDILDIETLRPAMQGADWVFHVAAIADDWRYPSEAVYRTNVDGTRNVLAAAWEAGVRRFVLTCSAAVLGVPTPDQPMLDETCRFNVSPRHWVYAHSKMLAEQLMLDFVERGLSAVSVMPTVILGPADTSFIGGQLITRVLDGGLFPMPEGGANLIDVRDVAEAHIAAAERGVPGERYVLGGHNMVHAVYLRIIGEVLKVPVNRLQIPRWTLPVVAEWVGLLQRLGVQMPMDRGRVLLCGRYMYYDNRKAVRELGLKLHPFEETVRDTFQWYAAHGFLARYGILGVPATADEAQEFLAEHHVSVV